MTNGGSSGDDRSGAVVELRVHGVSGTGPDALLGSSAGESVRVAGDARAGFYRLPAAAPAGSGPAWRRVVEAYSWGGLTSGPASRAVWLLFLPFILIDLAHWMLPPPTRHRRFASIAVGLLRLLALSFTLTLLLAGAAAVLDSAVWQCGSTDRCHDSFGPAFFFAGWERGPQLAFGALPLVAVIAVLWLLGRENLRYDPDRTPPDPAVLRDEVPLAAAEFWFADDSIRRLRACHVTAWAAGLAAIVLAAPTRYATGGRWVGLGLLSLNALILAVVIAATAWNRTTGRGGASADRSTRPLSALRWLSLAVLAGSLVWTAVAAVDYPAPPTHLPGLRGAIYVVLAVQVGLLAGLLGAIALAKRTVPAAADPVGHRATLRGYTAWYVALIGWLVGGAFSVGLGLLAAELLGDVVVSTARAEALLAMPGEAAPIIVAPPYAWAAVAIVGLLLVAAVAAVVLRQLGRTRARQAIAGVLDDYPGARADDPRIARIARARASASLADLLTVTVAGLALATVAGMAAMAWWYFSDQGGFEALPGRASTLTAASVLITAGMVGALGALVVAAYRDRGLRREVAVLWDVVTFWPRANHPLTPPCYGARTVPELRARLGELAADPQRRVVLSAHSQGSVIAAAALLQHRPNPERIGLLSFGSPLRRLYTGNFPAYFGPAALSALRDRQPARWINLWAYTDPIGGWVLDPRPGAVDRRLLDARTLADVPDGICGHSGFWTRPEYADAIGELQSDLLPAGTPLDPGPTVRPTETDL